MERLRKSKTLKKLGLNGKNEWILHDEKATKFFDWMSENLEDDNILSEEELRRYEELVKSGQYLEGEALEQEMKELQASFPGIMSITEEIIEEQERKLQLLESDSAQRSDRIKRMGEAEKKQSLKFTEMADAKHELECQLKIVVEDCVAKAETLSDLSRSNQKSIAHVKDSFVLPVRTFVISSCQSVLKRLILASSCMLDVSTANQRIPPETRSILVAVEVVQCEILQRGRPLQ